jgi:hypothetical protein
MSLEEQYSIALKNARYYGSQGQNLMASIWEEIESELRIKLFWEN